MRLNYNSTSIGDGKSYVFLDFTNMKNEKLKYKFIPFKIFDPKLTYTALKLKTLNFIEKSQLELYLSSFGDIEEQSSS